MICMKFKQLLPKYLHIPEENFCIVIEAFVRHQYHITSKYIRNSLYRTINIDIKQENSFRRMNHLKILNYNEKYKWGGGEGVVVDQNEQQIERKSPSSPSSFSLISFGTYLAMTPDSRGNAPGHPRGRWCPRHPPPGGTAHH